MILKIFSQYSQNNFYIKECNIKRDWMDKTSKSHAYHCLPVTSANLHGWTINLKNESIIEWDGINNINVVSGAAKKNVDGGYVTFDIPYIFVTEENYYLWLSGKPNEIKNDAQALNAVLRSDWYPSQIRFTWKLTKSGTIKFEQDYPIMFFMPYPKNLIDDVKIKIENLTNDKTLLENAKKYQHSVSKKITENNSFENWKWTKLYKEGKILENSESISINPEWMPNPQKINSCDIF